MMDRQIELLIREEGLDDLERLLTPREWDEVPLVSRLARIAFLSHEDVSERSRVLVTNAVRYLDRILAFAKDTGRDDVVVLVSVTDWEDLHSADPDPVIPNFWISTHPQTDLTAFRLRHGSSEEASLVSEWLRSADLLSTHEVFDAAEPVTDPELRRVYVAERASLRVKPFIQQQELGDDGPRGATASTG